MNLNLEGKVIFISGSSSGIGLGIADSLLNEGCEVIINGRSEKNLNHARDFLHKKFGVTIETILGDLTEHSFLEQFKKSFSKNYKSIDGIVANIGGVKKTKSWDINKEDWDWYFKNNFEVAFNTVQTLVPNLSGDGSSIVFIGSIAGLEELGAPMPYSSSKSALLSYAKSLSFRLAKKKIRVNMVSPGNIHFPNGNWDKKLKVNPDEIKKMLSEKVPLQKFGKPSDIGDIVAFLLSPRAGFITGANLVVDGGQTVGLK